MNETDPFYSEMERIKDGIEGRTLPKLPPLPPKEYTPSAYDLGVYNKVKQVIPKYSEEEKKFFTDKWNEKPQVKQNGIKAIDTEKEKSVKKGNYIILTIFAGLGILSLLVIAGAIGYSTYKTGSLVPSFNMTCPSVNINEGALSCGDNTCPDCPACSTTCGDCIVPDSIEIIVKNETD